MITLATLEQATEQQVFDQAVNHLLTQNKKSIEEGTCLYRHPKGLKCAAGCFISDDEYERITEGEVWEDSGAPDYHKKLIRKLQDIHDDIDVEEWEEALEYLATAYGLNFNSKN